MIKRETINNAWKEQRMEDEKPLSNKEKIEKYKEILGETEAIFVLDADIREVKIGERKEYRPTSFTDLDAHGYLSGGHSRVIAAAEIARFFPEIKIVTTSYYQPDKPIHAEIYAKELEKLCIPKEQIIMEKKSTSTLASLIELVKLAKNNDWSTISVLTSDYHVPRTKEMCCQLKNLAEKFNLADEEFINSLKSLRNRLKILYITAEEILPYRDKRYKKIIEAVKQTEAYKKRVEAEKQGLEQLKSGQYGRK